MERNLEFGALRVDSWCIRYWMISKQQIIIFPTDNNISDEQMPQYGFIIVNDTLLNCY